MEFFQAFDSLFNIYVYFIIFFMSNENLPTDLVGKKIFFLYPTGSVQNQVLTELVQQEYEVYVIKDHARIARALKKYTDSIVYINIDDGMPFVEWEKWVSGVVTATPDVKIGILTSNSDEEFRDKCVKNFHVTCGIFSLKFDMSKVAEKIIEALKPMDVKGRRKYLRANTERETTATVNMPHGGDFIKGTIKDISVVGISCTFETDPLLKKNSLVKNIQIRLQTILIKAEAVAIGSRDSDNGEKIYVLLFTQNVESDVRIKIHKYIQTNLQSKMDSELK